MGSAVALYPCIRIYLPFPFHKAISLTTGKWSDDLLMYSFEYTLYLSIITPHDLHQMPTFSGNLYVAKQKESLLEVGVIDGCVAHAHHAVGCRFWKKKQNKRILHKRGSKITTNAAYLSALHRMHRLPSSRFSLILPQSLTDLYLHSAFS